MNLRLNSYKLNYYLSIRGGFDSLYNKTKPSLLNGLKLPIHTWCDQRKP